MVGKGTGWRLAALAVAVAWAASVGFAAYQQGVRKEQNVFRIFRASYDHLIEGKDLYAPHPERHRDLFKYPPTFAFLFAPFALLPFFPGLLLWDVLNAGLLWWAIGRLLPPRKALIVRALVWLEMFRSVQHSQSNALVTGLIVLVFVFLEHGRRVAGAASLALGALVKVFPLGAGAFAFLSPRPWRFAALALAALVFLAALPLVAVPPSQLAEQYASWGRLMAEDARAQEDAPELPTGPGLYGGVMQQLRIWFGLPWPNVPVILAGTVLLLLPLLRGRSARGDPAFGRVFLASFLVYAVIFNHQSESPSFVIAMTGIGIWAVTMPDTWPRRAVVLLALAVLSIAALDLVPREIRAEFFNRYRLKTPPCLLAWIWMQADLWRMRSGVAKADRVAEPGRLSRMPAFPN